MNRTALAVVLLLLTSLAQAEQQLLRLHGSNTIGDKLAPVLAEQWLKSRGYSQVTVTETAPEERLVEGRDAKGRQLAVEIRAHGSTTAFTDLAAGSADLGMASRPIKGKEVAQLAPLGKLDDVRSEYVVGLDGVAVIVHPANPLARLDKATVRRIFAGEVDDWSQLGGPAGMIRVVARDDKSGTYDTFKSLVLDEGAKLVGTAGRYESSSELVAQVAGDPFAIGFVGLAYIQGVKALAIADGGAAISPEPFTVATEDYALARRLFLYAPTRGRNWQLAQDFARFAVSAAGQQALAPLGFISQEIEARQVAHGSEVPQEYAQFTYGAQRLSLNFRFDQGVFELDNKAKRDLERLTAYLTRPENARRKLLLFGFADPHERLPIKSLVLSVDRADAVAELLLMNGLKPYRVRGYGASVAVASNESELGRHRNRRVEVWLQ
ncbi:MAG TPA: phosphate ABC transporter substrate-binding/OmpA family protein [Gammaproteobacteria bacterium]